MRTRTANLLSTWFGCGYAPVAPGTVGSAAALIIAHILVRVAHWSALEVALLGGITIAPGVWAAGMTARARGSRDPSIVVVDEVVGQWITLAGARAWNWKSWLAAFLLFRILDVCKPFPARRLEALPAGAGIVADDVMAGLYAALVLFILGCFNLY